MMSFIDSAATDEVADLEFAAEQIQPDVAQARSDKDALGLHYQAVLDDMRAKREKSAQIVHSLSAQILDLEQKRSIEAEALRYWDLAFSALEQSIGGGRPKPINDTFQGRPPVSGIATTHGGGGSVRDAVLLVLSSGKTLNRTQITEKIIVSGTAAGKKNLIDQVSANLTQMKRFGEVARFTEGWRITKEGESTLSRSRSLGKI